MAVIDTNLESLKYDIANETKRLKASVNPFAHQRIKYCYISLAENGSRRSGRKRRYHLIPTMRKNKLKEKMYLYYIS